MAGLVFAANNLFGTPIDIFHAYGAFQIRSPLIATLTAPNAVAMLDSGRAVTP